MKNRRQEKILEIITEHDVETQEELLARLSDSGFRCTQSTVSRDLKQLHLIKEPLEGKGTYHYVVSPQRSAIHCADRMQRILHECCICCDYARNLVVLKTMPGLASAAGAALDGKQPERMVGCVCGDDTVFIIMREESSAQELCQQIQAICK